MLVPIILAFREGLEAILVLIIMLAYLKQTNQLAYSKYVVLGCVIAIGSSITFALIFNLLLGGFSGILEQLFEGFTFLISGFFIITLILWISREGPKMKIYIEGKINVSIQRGKLFTLTSLTFIIIVREGIELVLILTGTTSIGSLSPIFVIFGALIGLSIALLVGILTFYGVKTLNLSKFFKTTNIILILFAVGLITYGIHEFIEAGVINPIIPEVWNIKNVLPENFPDGNPVTFEILEIIGSILKALLGYNANPSLIEVIIYPILLVSIGLISYYIWNRSASRLKIESIEKLHENIIEI